MSPKDILQYPIETFRTAPLGISFAIASLCMTGGLVAQAVQEDSSTASEVIPIAISTANISLGISAARKQFKLRGRVENFIENHGFDERYFTRTTAEWCDRQTTRVACEKYGMLDKYVVVCDNNKQNDYLTYIPHL